MDLPGAPLPLILKYDTILDLDALYKKAIQWFVEQNYTFLETAYKGKATEIELSWAPYRKVNEYIKFIIKVGFHILEIKDLEVIKDGKKKKLTKARIRIEMNMDIEKDWKKRFKGHGKFVDSIKDFYDTHVFNKDMDILYEDRLYYDLYNLHHLLKTHLDSETKSHAY